MVLLTHSVSKMSVGGASQ